MKYLLLPFLIPIFLCSCGTTGHIEFYNFSVSKYEVEKQLVLVINNDSAFSVPLKWHEHTTGDFLRGIMYIFH